MWKVPDMWYVMLLLCNSNSTTLQAPMKAVLPSLCSTERRLTTDPQCTEVYCQETQKLEKMGYIAVVTPEAATATPES